MWLIVVSLMGTAFTSLALCGSVEAGNYVVVQCNAGLVPRGEARFSSNTSHFSRATQCGQNSLGFQIRHRLPTDGRGTLNGKYGAWTWQAPAGTYLTGGSAYGRLENADGISGYLAVKPDFGNGRVTENQNDDRVHLSAIPAGQWRYFVARLQCTAPNQGNRCVGSGFDAHAYIKQIRLQLSDVSPPSVSVGGSLLDGGARRGRNALFVTATDQGSGIRTVQITVNGVAAGGDDLSATCDPVPGGLTGRLSPCPLNILKGYTFDTAKPPFKHGENRVDVCVLDYAQTGTANPDCESRTILVDSLCPTSPVGGGKKVTATFADNQKQVRKIRYGRPTILSAQVRDAQGNPVERARVCVQSHPDAPGEDYRLIGTARTNSNGTWTHKLRPGTSRLVRITYRDDTYQVSRTLRLKVRATSSMRVSSKQTRPGRRVRFTGGIPGPMPPDEWS